MSINRTRSVWCLLIFLLPSGVLSGSTDLTFSSQSNGEGSATVRLHLDPNLSSADYPVVMAFTLADCNQVLSCTVAESDYFDILRFFEKGTSQLTGLALIRTQTEVALPTTVDLLTVCADQSLSITLGEDTVRGGMRTSGGMALTSNLPLQVEAVVPCGCLGDIAGETINRPFVPNGIVDSVDLQAMVTILQNEGAVVAIPTTDEVRCADIVGDTLDLLQGPNGVVDSVDLQALANYIVQFTPTLSGPCILPQ